MEIREGRQPDQCVDDYHSDGPVLVGSERQCSIAGYRSRANSVSYTTLKIKTVTPAIVGLIP